MQLYTSAPLSRLEQIDYESHKPFTQSSLLPLHLHLHCTTVRMKQVHRFQHASPHIMIDICSIADYCTLEE
jgi:hypothetical protein